MYELNSGKKFKSKIPETVNKTRIWKSVVFIWKFSKHLKIWIDTHLSRLIDYSMTFSIIFWQYSSEGFWPEFWPDFLSDFWPGFWPDLLGPENTYSVQIYWDGEIQCMILPVQRKQAEIQTNPKVYFGYSIPIFTTTSKTLNIRGSSLHGGPGSQWWWWSWWWVSWW